MAYTKIIVISNRLDQCLNYTQNEEKTSLRETLDYAMNRSKTERECFVTAINCESETAYADMQSTKRRWGKEGRRRKGYHVIQSFAPGEVTPKEAHAIGTELARRLLAEKYEVVISTHLDKAHLHSHIVFNSVSFVDGMMYRDSFQDLLGETGKGLRGTSDAICLEHGLSIIEPGEALKGPTVSRAEWETRKHGTPNFRELLREDIDTAIANSYTMRSFWSELQRMGCQIKRYPQVTHTAIMPPGGQKFLRLDGLGAGYTEADILARLAAGRNGTAPAISEHTPKLPIRYLPYARRYRACGRSPMKWARPKGFRLLYLKYLHLLSAPKYRRGGAGKSAVARTEIIKFERYREQFYYLLKNRIDSTDQLSMQYDAVQAEMDALTDHRADLYRQRRREPDNAAVREEIAAITARLRVLRREWKLCIRIEEDIPVVQAHTHRTEQEVAQKTKQNEPERTVITYQR